MRYVLLSMTSRMLCHTTRTDFWVKEKKKWHDAFSWSSELSQEYSSFPTDDNAKDFAGFLNNYVERKSNNYIIPSSLKWHVSDFTLGVA